MKKVKSLRKVRICLTILVAAAVFLCFFLYYGFRENYTLHTTMIAHTANDACRELKKLSAQFGYDNALSELTEQNTVYMDGDSFYRLQQNYKGIPVYGRSIVCVSDESGKVQAVSGNVVDITGDLSFTPSLSNEKLAEKMSAWARKEMTAAFAEEVPSTVDNGILTIYLLNESNPQLVYQFFWNGYELLVDAKDGTIVKAEPMIRAEKSVGILVGQLEEHNSISYTNLNGKLFLTDEDRRISTYIIEKEDKFIFSYLDEKPVWKSEREVSWIEGENPDPAAVDAYAYCQIAYDYFNEILDCRGMDGNGEVPISIYTGLEYYKNENSWKYAGGNAYFGRIKEANNAVLLFGTSKDGGPTAAGFLDIVAHEYTHGVTEYHSTLGDGKETRSIDEGLSDIFGELIEIWYERKMNEEYAVNWEHSGGRSIKDPLSKGYPATVRDKNKSDESDGHAYSTVISHAAYLMWNGINGNENKKISEDKLAKIWYRAMLMMPADCDFATCRQMVEWAALAVNGLTDAQRKCVGEAFDQVGIYDQKANSGLLLNCDYNVKPESALNVYDVDGELFAPYKLEIVGTYAEHELAYATNIISDAGMKYEKREIILSPKTCYLDLPDGYYTFRITAANNPNVEYEFSVSVSDQGTEECVDFYSEFRNQLIVPITSPKQDEEKKTENEEVSNLKTLEARISIRLGLHCEWAVIGDFDGDRAEEIYAITCFSSTDYSNAQVWYLSGAENKCILWLSEEEAELICRIVPLLPDWLTGRIIVSIDEIDDFVSDIKRKYF